MHARYIIKVIFFQSSLISANALCVCTFFSFKNGCSVRLLNPQTFSESVWKLNATLQEYFGSFVGANV